MNNWVFNVTKIGGSETLGEFVSGRKEYLRRLRLLHPIVAATSWMHDGSPRTAERLNDDLSNLSDSVFRKGWDRTVGSGWYSHFGENGPTLESIPETPYHLALTDTLKGASGLDIGLSSMTTTLPYSARVVLRLKNPALLDLQFLKNVIRVTVDQFDPDFCKVSNTKLRKLVGDGFDTDYPGIINLGWINYFGNPQVREAMPPSVELEDCGPGVIMTTQPTVPDLTDPDDIQHSKMVIAHLRPTGWLNYDRMKRSGDGGASDSGTGDT